MIVATHYVGGIATFGSSFLAVPLLVLLYGPDQLERVVVVMMAVGVLQAYLIFWRTRRSVAKPELTTMLAGACVGMPLGIYGVGHLSPSWVMPLIGALILAAGVINLRGSRSLSKKHNPAVTGFASMLAGVIHGAFASGGTVLVAYAQRILPDKQAFRATLAGFWSCTNTAFLMVAVALGSLGTTELGLSGVAGALVLPVTWLADRTARRLDQQMFHQGVCVLLMCSGAALLVREGFP
ncbi:MAG: sulfite exporter TauE/SafE family protein [Planctomycetota bacterium]